MNSQNADIFAKDMHPGAGQHVPVMLAEVIDCLQVEDGGLYVDGTFGGGGYTRAMLDRADCRVIAIDRDPDAIARAKKLQQTYGARLTVIEGCFGDVAALLQTAGVARVDGFVLDLGVSSMQLDQRERGFSFREEGPLDMRMSRSGLSAADVVNTMSEGDIADILYNFGDEKASRRIAKRIVAARTEKPITTTADLARIIHSVLPMHGGMKTDTATRSFQAIRIYVNDELGELDRALLSASAILKTEGRLVIVSFHSLEDGRVKKFFRDMSGNAPQGSRHLPPATGMASAPLFRLSGKGVLSPSDAECAANPRSRSARLRFGIYTGSEGGSDA